MPDALRVLVATPEAHPLIKTGGLGDVGGALPRALRESGVDARLLVPAYEGLIERLNAEPLSAPLRVLPDVLPVRLYQALMPDEDTPVYLIDAPSLYRRSGPYVDQNGRDWPDNALRFGALSRTAAIFGSDNVSFGWRPQIVHCNDWQTGLTPAYLSLSPGARARTLITVHNMAFQGVFPPSYLAHLCLPGSSFDIDGLEFHRQISFLKAGLRYADHITAVSPTYAKEIQTPEFGCGLDGLLAQRRDQLTGILNGVDRTEWDPAHDPQLPANYSSDNLEAKGQSKSVLQQRFGLKKAPGTPVLAIVSRLTNQKGIDLVLGIAEQLLAQPVQLAVLGSGENAFEAEFRRLQSGHPGRVGVHIGYDEGLAHLVEAGADIFLMPSRFEPCGLNQMYSMLYGTPPVVHRTGGLADTVIDATPSTLARGTATGFVFANENQTEFLSCLMRALILYQNREAWRRLQRTGMSQDFGWKRSALRYSRVYDSLLSRPRRR